MLATGINKVGPTLSPSIYRGISGRVLIILGTRQYEVVCHCFPRRLYFRWVYRNLAAHLVLGGHGGVMEIDLARPQQGDLRLSGPPPGQGAGGGARTRDRMLPADLKADSLATVPPTARIPLETETGS
ncbi:hypothetical protein PoB_004467900 [Plakobranchus ocellatus]|uniref:Uncharacterized protein n=1 Tax=Plakobranchus ocellatus TaxID=259542 RepID=A0AAV4BH44_9GAST|nr:hypothetical protein PoB_004467900 [Plakobranchus ocellatus]